MFIEKNLLNGVWFHTEETMSIRNPATKEILGTVPKSSKEEALKAVDAADAAFASWSTTTAYERSTLLRKWYDLIEENKEILAKTMTLEQGKPLEEAIGEIHYANQYVAWYAEEAKRIYGDLIPSSSSEKRLFVQKVPVGVVAAITPWNFPAAMITRKLAPALAAGCTVVLKPSEETPFTALKLGELAEQAGIPKGVINILTGDAKEIVGVWQKDPRVRKITFTGSTPVGKILMKEAADTMKKLSLELGGQAPFIVTNKADVDLAVKGAIQSKFRNGGQACVAANRFLVQEDIADEFLTKFAKQTAQFTYGNGLKEGVSIGPLINENAVVKVAEHVQDAIQKGATIVTGGHRVLEESGYFFQPTILKNASDDMLCMREETFGPVAPVSTFKTIEEAIERANKSPYGLAAYVFTQDISEALAIVEKIDYGVVGLNDGLPSAAQAPFGGFKESGLGREGGKEGISDFLEVKYISMGTIKKQIMEDFKMKKHILMVVTTADKMKENHETGLWLSEFGEAYVEFSKLGYDITVASPKGGKAPIDDRSLEGEVPQEILDTEKYLENTVKLEDIKDSSAYDAIFMPGGHGTMFDLPDNTKLHELTRDMFEANKLVAAVCHGPAGLVGVKLTDGTPLVAGKTITTFTDDEERETTLDRFMPFLLETRLRELGANVIVKENWADHVQVDGNLITGQNPQSTISVAKEVVKKLQN